MPYGSVNADKMTTSDGVSSSGLYGFKNRILNGQMVIDQRNAGASVATSSGNNIYTLDRWQVIYSQTSKFTIQQTPSTTETGYATRIGAGFSNYAAFTSTSAYSVNSTDFFLIRQPIEGFNIADFAFGTSSAKAVTLSFWVNSSLTGTFGGSITNAAENRCYPFSYSVSSANTWTQISITIAGCTDGTWATNNTSGIKLFLSLGCGSTNSGTAGSWSTSTYYTTTGATSVVGTNGATFYITGVQLEKGSTATSFDYRPYGTELQLCQRYFETSMSVAPADNMSVASTGVYAIASSAGTPLLTVQFKVTKRTDPTVTYYAPLTTSPSGKFREDATGTIRTATGGGATNWGAIIGVSSGTSSVAYQFGYQASAEL